MIYFSADYHINHRNILKYCNRPFTTIQEHDQHIISQTNKHVKSDDTLYFLGDLLFANKKYYFENLRNLLVKIKCQNIVWVLGNHDPARTSAQSYLKLLRQENIRNISNALDYTEGYLNNKFFIICHYALAIWNKQHHGAYHIYGHSHSTAETNLDSLFPGRRSMDVGIDNAYKLYGEYRPFSINEVVALLDNKHANARSRAVTIDHHK